MRMETVTLLAAMIAAAGIGSIYLNYVSAIFLEDEKWE